MLGANPNHLHINNTRLSDWVAFLFCSERDVAMVSLLIKIVLAVVLGSILSWIIAVAAIFTLLWWLNKDE